MKAALFCDDWKLPTFEQQLKDAGFEFETHQIEGESITLLMVTYSSDTANRLEKVVAAAQAEARKAMDH